jgi:tetratricopeptide (TPR) repeat protein
VAAYLPALGAGFVWDDDAYVVDNPMLRSPGGLGRIWTDTAATPQYYPLTHTTFWIEYQLWGLRPAGYHAVNVVLHAISALLLWTVLRRLRVPGAWLGAALFALHPIQVESVAWITERKNVLSGLFYLAACLAYLRFARLDDDREDPTRSRSRVTYLVAFVLFVCALLSKTVTASLPVALALVIWWKRGRLGGRDLKPLVPMIAIGTIFGGLTAWLERVQVGAEGAEWSLSLLQRFLLAPRIVWHYLEKLAWPAELTFIYPRWSIRPADPAAWVWPVALVGLFVALWFVRRRLGRGPLTALAYFVITLGPALGFINVYPMRYSFVADHFQYLAGIGPLALAGAAVWRTTASATRRFGPTATGVARVSTSALLVGTLALLTAAQARVYESLEVLWRDTLAKNPEAWAAHNNLGAMLGERGSLEEAASHLEQAIRLKPDHAGAWANLGVVRARQGRLDDALSRFQRGVELDPDDAGSRILLGEALARSGRVGEAEVQLARAVELDPDDPRGHHLRADLLVSRGEFEEALPHYRAVLAKLPEDFSSNLNLGSALAKLGRGDEALPHLEAAVRLEPESVDALYTLGVLLLRTGRAEESAARLGEALALDPGNRAVRERLEQARAQID